METVSPWLVFCRDARRERAEKPRRAGVGPERGNHFGRAEVFRPLAPPAATTEAARGGGTAKRRARRSRGRHSFPARVAASRESRAGRPRCAARRKRPPREGSRCRERRACRMRARLTGRYGGWSGAKVEKRESRQRGSVDARLGESENLSKPFPKKCYGGHSAESGTGYRTGNRPSAKTTANSQA